MSRVASPKHDSVAAENELYQTQLKKSLRKAMADRDPRRIQITRLKYGLEMVSSGRIRRSPNAST